MGRRIRKVLAFFERSYQSAKRRVNKNDSANSKQVTAEKVASNEIKPDTVVDNKSKDDKTKPSKGLSLEDKNNLKTDVIVTTTPASLNDRPTEKRKDDFLVKKLEVLSLEDEKSDKSTSLPDTSVVKNLNDERKKAPTKEEDEKINKKQLLVENTKELTDKINKKHVSTNKSEIAKDSAAVNKINNGAAKEQDQDSLVKDLEKISLKEDKLDETKSDKDSAKPENEHRKSSAENPKKSKDGHRRTHKDSHRRSSKDKRHGQKNEDKNKPIILYRSRGHDTKARKKEKHVEERFQSCSIKDTRPKTNADVENTESTNLNYDIDAILNSYNNTQIVNEGALSTQDHQQQSLYQNEVQETSRNIDIGNNEDITYPCQSNGDVTSSYGEYLQTVLTCEDYDKVYGALDNLDVLNDIDDVITNNNACYNEMLTQTPNIPNLDGMEIDLTQDSPEPEIIKPVIVPQNVQSTKVGSKKQTMVQIKQKQRSLVDPLKATCCRDPRYKKDKKVTWESPKVVIDPQEMAPIISKILKLPLEIALRELLKIMHLTSGGLGHHQMAPPKSNEVEATLYSMFIHIGNRVIGQRPVLFLRQKAARLLELAMLSFNKDPFYTLYLLSSIRVAYREVHKNERVVEMPVFPGEPDKVAELTRRIETFTSLGPDAFIKGDTLIHILARLGMADGLQEILMDDSVILFDINAKNDNDFTALHEAVRFYKLNKDADPTPWLRVVHLLLKHGKADPKIQEAFGGETAPHMALDDFNLMLVFTSHLDPDERKSFAKIENRLGISLAAAAKKLTPPNADVINFLEKCKSFKHRNTKFPVSSPSNQTKPSSMLSPPSGTDQSPFSHTSNPSPTGFSDFKLPSYLQPQPDFDQSKMTQSLTMYQSSFTSTTPNQSPSLLTLSPQSCMPDQFYSSSKSTNPMLSSSSCLNLDTKFTENLSQMCTSTVEMQSLPMNHLSPPMNLQSPPTYHQSPSIYNQSSPPFSPLSSSSFPSPAHEVPFDEFLVDYPFMMEQQTNLLPVNQQI